MAEADRMLIQAVQTNNFDLDAECYNICTAPCQKVVARNTHVVVSKELEKFYPDDPGIRLLGSKSFVGHPLYDEEGNCSGIFILEWRREISEAEAENVLKDLSALAPRISSEITQLQLETNLNTLSLTSSDTFQDDVDVFRTLAVQAAEVHKHATYSAQIPLANGLPEISAADAHVEQIMVNLILNAIDAIDERTGTLKISTQLADVSVEEHRKYYRLWAWRGANRDDAGSH